jgi:hypothetical protein
VLAGHYAPALAIKALFPRTPLWLLFVGVQAVDIAWALFVLTGIEQAHIKPGFTASNGLVLEQVVYSHSLLAAFGWSAGLAVVTHLALRRPTASVAMAFAVASHWLLDLPMHTPDLPFSDNASPKFGLGLWNNRELSFLLEAWLLMVGGWLWNRGPGAAIALNRRRGLAIALGALCFSGYYGFQPDTIEVTAAIGLSVYVALPALARWIETPKAE